MPPSIFYKGGRAVLAENSLQAANIFRSGEAEILMKKRVAIVGLLALIVAVMMYLVLKQTMPETTAIIVAVCVGLAINFSGSIGVLEVAHKEARAHRNGQLALSALEGH